MFVTLAMPTQSFFQLLVLLGKKNGGCRTSATLTHHVSCAGQWNSALESKSALRAHVARAAAIELAQSEGQKVIHFFWDMWKCMTA